MLARIFINVATSAEKHHKRLLAGSDDKFAIRQCPASGQSLAALPINSFGIFNTSETGRPLVCRGRKNSPDILLLCRKECWEDRERKA